MNPYEQMDSGYPDSGNSSPRSRENDSDHRWEAGDSAGGSRFRLMCSYGGKIQQRSHDNQLSYVGGDTHILVMDRNVGFASMNAKLSSLWGTGVSFKYQLPNEDLDALVSVTNDEDMENMMVEYDRLQKMGYRFSRLRLFVFANKPDGTSSQSNLGEETKQESWFVDALNVGPVSRSETVPQRGPWMNNMPNNLSGLEANGVEGDPSSAQRGYALSDQEAYMGRDQLQQPEAQSDPSSPITGYSSVDSIASARSRTIISAAPQRSDCRGANQTEVGINRGHGFEQDSKLSANYSKSTDSSPVPEIGVLKIADGTANANIQKREQYTSEVSVVSSSLINERATQQPQLQVPIQEFQKLQLRQPQDPIAQPVDDYGNLNIPGRGMYSDPLRAVDLSNQYITRPNPVDQAYMPQQQQQIQQNPSPSEYYMHNQGPHFVSQSYWQSQEPHGDQQYHHPAVNFSHQDITRLNPVDQVYMPQQQQIQQNPSPSGYYMHDQGSHFVSQGYWQNQEPHGDQQYHPPYFVHTGSAMLQQPMSGVRPMGQAVPGAGGGGFYYNPVQRLPAPVHLYSSEAMPSSNPATTVQRQINSDPTESYRAPIQIPAPAPKGPYTLVPSGPVAGDARVMYRPTVPASQAHMEPYSYQKVMYEPSSRQVYHTQAPQAMNLRYPSINPDM